MDVATSAISNKNAPAELQVETDAGADKNDPSVSIPELEGFSFNKLWAFTGPGFLMSIAFLDPGNIESDLQAGAITKYKLLWLLLSSTLLGLLMQRLAARLGTVTGLHLAEWCYRLYNRGTRIFIWLMVEVAIIGSDMQEVIGIAIALHLLSDKAVSLPMGVLMTGLDAFAFSILDKYSLRKLEYLAGFFLLIMAVSFGYQFFVVQPNAEDMLEGMLIPGCSDCDGRAFLQAIGIIGAIIMPHNMYLHSGLVTSRKIDRSKKYKVSEANLYFFVESGVALFISFLINLAVVIVFANGLFNRTNRDMLEVCSTSDVDYEGIFPNNTLLVNVDIFKGGVYLGCRFGSLTMYIWAIGILAAGLSSTMTGCYTGQFTLQGFLNVHWCRWKRVALNRSLSILPTFCIALLGSLDDLSGMNDIMNAVMSIQLPFAILPLLAFTSNRCIMGEFVNGTVNIIVTLVMTSVIIVINLSFAVHTIMFKYKLSVMLIIVLFGFTTIYLVICLFLLIHLYLSVNNTECDKFSQKSRSS